MSALDSIRAVLVQYGLPESLLTWAETALRDPAMTEDRLLLELRQQPEYKDRFPAMDALGQSGRAISETDYINYEKAVYGLAQQYGVPEEMFTRTYIADMLTNDVSAREFEERIGISVEAARMAPAEVRTAFANMYGLGSDGALTAYFLDPDEALPVIQRRFEAAQIAGVAERYRFTYDAAEMERLAAQGVTTETAQRGFQTAASLRPLNAAAGDAATEDDLVASQFGDVEARRRVERAQKARRSGFAASGGTQAERGGVSGLGQAAT